MLRKILLLITLVFIFSGVSFGQEDESDDEGAASGSGSGLSVKLGGEIAVEMSGIKDIQGRLTATITKMTTHAAGTSTTITMNTIEYDKDILNGYFTERFLATGQL